jgi:hypothetical protein
LLLTLLVLCAAALAISVSGAAGSTPVTTDDTSATFVSEPAQESNIFLCYSAWQVDPGVWTESVASNLVATAGYWQPFAVKGNVLDGTNVGDYHLVCNLPAGQSVPAKHGYVGDGGTIVEQDMHDALATTLGWYPIVP